MLIMAQPFNYWWTNSTVKTELNKDTAPPNKKNEALTGPKNTPISLRSEFLDWRDFLCVGLGAVQLCPSEATNLIHLFNESSARWTVKKSLFSSSGYYGSNTELTDHYNDELNALALRLLPLCRCVLLYLCLLRGSVGCRSPPSDLNFPNSNRNGG